MGVPLKITAPKVRRLFFIGREGSWDMNTLACPACQFSELRTPKAESTAPGRDSDEGSRSRQSTTASASPAD